MRENRRPPGTPRPKKQELSYTPNGWGKSETKKKNKNGVIYKRQNKKGLLIKSTHIFEENECGKERSAPQTQYTPMKQNDNNTNPAEKT